MIVAPKRPLSLSFPPFACTVLCDGVKLRSGFAFWAHSDEVGTDPSPAATTCNVSECPLSARKLPARLPAGRRGASKAPRPCGAGRRREDALGV